MMIVKKRLLLTLPLVLVLIFLILQSFNRGISSIFYINFRYFIAEPEANERLNKAESLLNTANDFSAHNPRYYLFKGSVKTLQANAQETALSKANLLTEASDSYIQSILLQADNPFAWLGLVQTNYYQGKNNYPVYLERALKFGASNQAVLLNYFYFSLVHWDKMEKIKQDSAVDLLQQTILSQDFLLHDSGKRLDNILVEYKIKSEVCAKMIPEKKIQAFCNKIYKPD